VKKSKRIVVISDLHCGHRIGLTPPDYAPRNKTKWSKAQRALWREYNRMVKEHSPVDVLFVLGDCIDGRGEKSGSTELITTDRQIQCQMAADCINMWNAPKIAMVFGTAYHAGQREDWESIVAEMVQADKIGGQEWVDVNGICFDLKHFTSMSQIPHGFGTSLARDTWLWNTIWQIRKEQPKVDVFLRGHVHNFGYIGNDSFLAVTCPALQGLGSKFGARIPSRRVDFGIMWFDTPGKHGGLFDWDWDIVTVKEQRPKVLSF